jgi:hypothetical protein
MAKRKHNRSGELERERERERERENALKRRKKRKNVEVSLGPSDGWREKCVLLFTPEKLAGGQRAGNARSSSGSLAVMPMTGHASFFPSFFLPSSLPLSPDRQVR